MEKIKAERKGICIFEKVTPQTKIRVEGPCKEVKEIVEKLQGKSE